MKVKRYMGKTNQEALEKVRNSLGNDAIILSTRKIRRKGIKGLFSKPLIEVVAAIDDSNPLSRSTIESTGGFSNHKFIEIEKQINTINMTMDKLLNKLEADDSTINKTVSSDLLDYSNRLIDREIQRDIAKKLVEDAYNLHLKENAEFTRCLYSVMVNSLGHSRPMATKIDKQKIVLFIGPTGVGKTTTLVKLAAMYSIKYNYKVGLITADTYRIAAVDQLRIYSEILDIPLEVIYSPDEIVDTLDHFSDKDIVFIDTAGKSIKDTDQPEEIGTLLTLSKADEVFLCISASTSYQGCVNIINSYEFIDDYSIIYTKVDEVKYYGNMFNCCYISGKPMSYMTTGQSVPDDIEALYPSIIMDNLMPW